MKEVELLGMEKNKSERKDRRVLRSFFYSNSLDFFTYIDKTLWSPRGRIHYKQRFLQWLIDGSEEPELDNHRDALGSMVWEYYEDKIDQNLLMMPQTDDSSGEDYKYVMQSYYFNILKEINQLVWYEIDAKLNSDRLR